MLKYKYEIFIYFKQLKTLLENQTEKTPDIALLSVASGRKVLIMAYLKSTERQVRTFIIWNR